MAGIDYYTYTRDTSKDKTIYTTPRTVYTDSTTLTAGMTVYDNTGTDTGYVVGNISNNSFDRCVTLSFTFGGSESQLFSGTITVNGNSVLYSDTVCVPYNQSCTIVATNSYKGISIAIGGTEVAHNSSPVSYTFTPTANTVIGLSQTDGKY